MNVYVESNFILELVYEQSESAACEALLGLAEVRAVRLVVPFFALVEPEWTLKGRSRGRRGAEETVKQTLVQIRRNRTLGAESLRLSTELGALLTRCEQSEDQLIRSTRRRMLDIAVVLKADVQTLRAAEQVMNEHGLALFDAIMLASVLLDLESRGGERSCFLNRNASDFAVPSIRQALGSCKFFPNFEGGHNYVCDMLGRSHRS